MRILNSYSIPYILRSRKRSLKLYVLTITSTRDYQINRIDISPTQAATTTTPLLRNIRKTHVLNCMYIRKSRINMLDNREIRTRVLLFNVITPRCEAFKQNIDYFGATALNALDPENRNIDSFAMFKSKQKRVIAGSCRLLGTDEWILALFWLPI